MKERKQAIKSIGLSGSLKFLKKNKITNVISNVSRIAPNPIFMSSAVIYGVYLFNELDKTSVLRLISGLHL